MKMLEEGDAFADSIIVWILNEAVNSNNVVFYDYSGGDKISKEEAKARLKTEFFIFQEKCHKTLDNIKFTQKEFNKFIKDIYESLLILQKSNFIHNDIKADNVIYCDNKYKLIDWDLSKDLGKSK